MTKIPFADVKFPPLGEINSFDVEARLKTFLQAYRKKNSPNKEHWVLSDDDWDKITRRAKAYIAVRGQISKMGHLDRIDRDKLAMFRDGIELRAISSEHQADEIASELHTEMPWMAKATDRVWKELRASARRGDPGVQYRPCSLLGLQALAKATGRNCWGNTSQFQQQLLRPLTNLRLSVLVELNADGLISNRGDSCKP